MSYTYPLKLHFKLLALAPRVSITDANGQEILYVEQKVLALKEAVKVFDNSTDKNLLYTMQANQIIDFGAKYIFNNAKTNTVIGSIQQEGMRSLVQASYTVHDTHDQPTYKIVQANPLISLLDSVLSIIPFAELLTGFILNPQYSVMKEGFEKPLLIMKKKPSFFEASFEITHDNEKIESKDELLLMLSLIMVVQLEKNRG